MEPQEKLTTQQFVVDRLQDIQRKAETSKFTDALSIIKEVKIADSKNIYLIAIEKQIAKLCDSSLPEESRSGIVRSLPSMIDRAISDIQRRAPAPKVDESQKEQKEAALEKLKSQYFQRADDYVEKQEYQRALEEIRRIYIIEPGSVVAKEYEKKIEQLDALHARNESQAAASAEIKETKAREQEAKVKIKEPKKADPVAETKNEEVVLQQPEEDSKKSKLLIPIAAAAAVVILAVGAWLFFSRGSSSGTQTNPDQAQLQSSIQDSVIISSPATSIPQSGKGSAPIAEASKQPVKIEKKQPEVKTVQPAVTTPVKNPSTTQPTNTQSQAGQTPVVSATQEPAQQQPKAAESTPAPIPFVAIENPPEVLRRVQPEYPEIAIKMGLQGRVTVEVTVDAQGKPIQAKILKSPSDIFNDAAVEAVMKYTYKPAMMSTGPVTAKVTIPIDFRLK
jgi:protein TonB